MDAPKQEPGKVAPSLSRQQSLKDIGDTGETKAPSTPGTPLTPADASMMRVGPHSAGVPSPHQSGVYGQPSPGMPSPKIMPSPKSQPSPRTPGETHIGQQQSPFSQHSIQSPFSPSAQPTASAPQSPYAGSVPKSQSPFALPTVSGQQASAMIGQGSPLPTSYSPAHTPPTVFPVQRSPRANVPQQGQFPQGQFPPGFQPRGMVPGQTAMPFNQAGMRQPVPGVRPTNSLPMSQQQMIAQGSDPRPEMATQGMRPMHPGMRLERPPYPGHPPSSPGKPGQGQAPGSMYPGMPGMRASTPGSQPFMNQPGVGHPGGMVSTATTGAPAVTTTATQGRTPLLQDQPLLIQDLLEQVSISASYLFLSGIWLIKLSGSRIVTARMEIKIKHYCWK